MAAYKDLVGQKITKVTSNPGEPKTGQMWYNSTSGTLRGLGVVEAFSSSASMGTGRYQAMWAGEGTQNATLSCSGRTAAPAIVTNTEEYNGSGWTVGGACNNAENSCAGFGTQTAAIKTGGYPGSDPEGLATESESYNGTSWTAGNAISPGRQGHAGAGVSTAGVIFGGNDGTVLNKTEEFNGTNFSNVNNMNTARQNLSGVGIQTAALAAGGGTTPVTTAAEVYDGTNWTTVGSMNTARQGMGSFGTSTSAAVTGGTTGSNSTATETWDGTSWTTSPATLATARAFYGDCGAGSSTAGIVAGGYSTATIGNTEEYNKSTNVITAGAWSSGGNLNTARRSAAGFGTQTAAVVAGGTTSAPGYTGTANSEEYDGSSWTEGNNMNTPRANINSAGYGPQTSGNIVGGAAPSTGLTNYETYDGTDYSNGPVLNTGRFAAAGIGTSTAGLCMGGYYDPGGTNGSTNSEEYGGSSWAAGNAMNNARYDGMGFGTQTAGAIAGGYATAAIANVEEYNGTSWTNATALANPQRIGGSVGTQTDALIFGGLLGPSEAKSTLAQGYDGTTWSSRPSMGTARIQISPASAGTSVLTLAAGGNIQNPVTNATEEFTGETSAANITDFTTS